jgi:hypothetical protein
MWEPPTRQFYPYFPAFEPPPATYPITEGQTSANLHWQALQGVKNGASIAPVVSGSRGATQTTNKWEPTYQPASRIYESQPADYQSTHIVSWPPIQTGPIGSSLAQLSRRASIALAGLHSVPATSSCPSQSSFNTSYEQRPC